MNTVIQADIKSHLENRIVAELDKLRDEWKNSNPTRHIVLDNVLPVFLANKIGELFPKQEILIRTKDLKECKFAGNHTDKYQEIINECLRAFHSDKILKALKEITGYKELRADPNLYASGVSSMKKGDFLNPHLDNSHDGNHSGYRCLNALYYVSKDWVGPWGGSLELWEKGLKNKRTIPALFNRLVIMETGRTSWHSVTPISVNQDRNCLSNYFFSDSHSDGRFRHVTSFYGRPREFFKRPLLFWDRLWRNAAGKLMSNILLEKIQKKKR